MYLIGFRNRLRVMIEWIWYYITNRPGIRLIVKYTEASFSKS
jgi:NADH dehydrogenase